MKRNNTFILEIAAFFALVIILIIGSSEPQAAERNMVHVASAHLITDGLNPYTIGYGREFKKPGSMFAVRAGGYWNSYKKPTAYAAATMGFEFDGREMIVVGAGVASGYKFDTETRRVSGKTASFIPVIAVEFRFTKHTSAILLGEAVNLMVRF